LSEALTIIRRAQQPDRPDWRLLSAEAAILDQLGDVALARTLYNQAIDLAPGEASLLSNLAMSFVLGGDLPHAEQLLRQAVALPTADSRVRQNLALVVGLQGRFEEAEAIARRELSPEQAEANIAYLRAMLASPDAWTQLAEGQGAI
jgi:Flp pilus assembly protein TadD